MLSPGGACGAASAARCSPTLHQATTSRAARAVRRRRIATSPRAAAANGGSAAGGRDPALTGSFDNAGDARSTIIIVKASNRPGVLHAITTTFKDLALSVNKAEVDMDGELLSGALQHLPSQPCPNSARPVAP